jgi:anti-sigma B factor antagonist
MSVMDDGARQVVTALIPGLNRLRLVVSGELDLATSPQLLMAVKDALDSPSCRDIIIDMSEVTLADAHAVGTLVLAYLACRHVGGRLTVFGARGVVAEVLQLTGVGALVGLGAPGSVMVGPARRRFSH